MSLSPLFLLLPAPEPDLCDNTSTLPEYTSSIRSPSSFFAFFWLNPRVNGHSTCDLRLLDTKNSSVLVMPSSCCCSDWLHLECEESEVNNEASQLLRFWDGRLLDCDESAVTEANVTRKEFEVA